MMQTRCKCVANMVNAVFTSLLHRACKCVSKYGIYHVCYTFAPRLHHICSWVNVSKSNFSCSGKYMLLAKLSQLTMLESYMFHIWGSALVHFIKISAPAIFWLKVFSCLFFVLPLCRPTNDIWQIMERRQYTWCNNTNDRPHKSGNWIFQYK